MTHSKTLTVRTRILRALVVVPIALLALLLPACVESTGEEDLRTDCTTDAQCGLIDIDKLDECCGCGSIDYSLDNFVAVSLQSYREVKEDLCPDGQCAIGCPNQIVNDNYEARCVQQRCAKVAKPQRHP